MSDFIAGIGVAMFLEGLLWAAFPDLGLRMLALAAATPVGRLRSQGLAVLLLGVALVWMVRG